MNSLYQSNADRDHMAPEVVQENDLKEVYIRQSHIEPQQEIPITRQQDRQRICGLAPLTFWLFALAIVIILAGAIGGGIGGGLAKGNNRSDLFILFVALVR